MEKVIGTGQHLEAIKSPSRVGSLSASNKNKDIITFKTAILATHGDDENRSESISQVDDIHYLREPIRTYSALNNSRIYIVLSESEQAISQAFAASSLKEQNSSEYAIVSDPDLTIAKELTTIISSTVSDSESSSSGGSALDPVQLSTATVLLTFDGTLLKFEKFNVSGQYDADVILSCMRSYSGNNDSNTSSDSNNDSANINNNDYSYTNSRNNNKNDSSNNNNYSSNNNNSNDSCNNTNINKTNINNISSNNDSNKNLSGQSGKSGIQGSPDPEDGFLLKSLSQFAAYYKARLKEKPLQTKAITSCIISIFGEALGSYLKYRKYLSKNPQTADSRSLTSFLDPKRFVIFGVYGLAITAPTFHWWYGFLERFVSARQLSFVKTVFAKLGMDRLLLTPPFLAFTLAYLQFTQTLSVSQTMRNMKNGYAAALFMNWKIWTPAQAINFTVVPVDYRVLFGNMVALWWNIYLSLAN